MWNRFKNLFSAGEGEPVPGRGEGIPLRWHEPGAGNPFGIRVLDCQPLTRTIVTTTSDPRIAEQYARLRGSDGRDLIGASIPDATHVATSLRFPHNGASLHGVVFKSPEMEVKWDIYCYDSTFLFARSWTGDLWFRAAAVIGHDDFHITDIECRGSDANVAASHVYFLVATHAMGLVLPHRVPGDTPNDPMVIATLSFSLFGNRGWYATFEDVTRLPIPRPGGTADRTP